MPWFRVDDGFHGHPKVVDLSLEAVGLWTLAGSWCASYLTDGEISSRTVGRLGGRDESAAELVDAGLWVEVADGYRFKDWCEYQPSKEQVEQERAAARVRIQKWRAKRKGVGGRNDEEGGSDESNDVGNAVTPPVTNGVRNGGSTEEVRVPLPSPSPSPSPSQSSTSEVADATLRPDVEHLLDLLDSLIVANGSKKPKRNQANIDAARLILDKDGRTVEQVEAAIRWCQADSFWRGNVMSMVKLRDKYDQLRLAAINEREKQQQQSTQRKSIASQGAFDILGQMDEVRNESQGDGHGGGVRELVRAPHDD